MSRRAKRWTIAMVIFFAIAMFGNIPVWREDTHRREKQAELFELISEGQSLDRACETLQEAGFSFARDSPIAVGMDKDELMQTVRISENSLNGFETFGYVTNLPWVPYQQKESYWVNLYATPDGTITRIE